MTRLVLELDDDFHQKVKVKAAKEDKSMRDIMTELLEDWLKNGSKKSA